MKNSVFSKKGTVGLIIFLIILGFLIINNLNNLDKTIDNLKLGLTTKTALAIDDTKKAPFGPETFIKVAENEKPSVVNISTTQIIKRQSQREFGFRGPFREDDPFREFFEKFFGDIPQGDIKRRSLGSGFIISKEGLILTNNHVVQRATEIKVTLHDEREFDAKVIGTDPKTDLALIKIKAKVDLPVAKLGDSNTLKVGEWVMAIGNPFGLSETVTVGVVSAKGRIIGAGPYDNFIQTDASINPGNSGGPLLNVKGEVVGINSAIYSGGQGIGFAIPINIARDILDDLKTKGTVVRGWLGVLIQKITPDLAKSFDLSESEGALVSDVVANGPADKAGIKRGDVIIEYEGKKIKSMEMLPRVVAVTKPGTRVNITVLRNGTKKKFKVTIEQLKETRAEISQDIEKTLGMSVQEITPEIAKYFDLEDQKGVIVSNTEKDSLAWESGLRQGDIIKEINRQKVSNIADYRRLMKSIKEKSTILFLVKRGENTIFIAVKTG